MGEVAESRISPKSASGTCFYCKHWVTSPFCLHNWPLHPVSVATSDGISSFPKFYGSVLYGFSC